jgi:hypothetical protein
VCCFVDRYLIGFKEPRTLPARLSDILSTAPKKANLFTRIRLIICSVVTLTKSGRRMSSERLEKQNNAIAITDDDEPDDW